MKTSNLIAIIAAIILIAGGAFYGGMVYGGKNTIAAPRSFGANGANGTAFAGNQRNGATRMGQGLITGEIISKDDTGLTVKINDGGSKNVFISSSTQVGKFEQGTITDLESGQTVMVNGTTNTDGSLTATMVQIRPAGDVPGFGGGRPAGAPAQDTPPQQ